MCIHIYIYICTCIYIYVYMKEAIVHAHVLKRPTKVLFFRIITEEAMGWLRLVGSLKL